MHAIKFILIIGILFIQQCLAQDPSLDDLINGIFNNTNGGIDDIINNNNRGGTPSIPTSAPPLKNVTHQEVKLTGCDPGYDCVQYFLCKNEKILTDGENLLDIRLGENESKPCPFLEQCCAVGDQTDIPVIKKPDPTPDGCGHRNTDGIGFRITGKSDETEYGEFPWMVAVLSEEQEINQKLYIYQCGGSIIHPQVVLTAAHCVQNRDPKTLKVRGGEWDTQTKNELYPDQDRDVAEVIVHPNYNKGSLFNDIALLYLSEPFDLADNIKTVCLPPQDTQFDYERCIATGWGKDTFGQEGKYQVILKKLDLPIVPKDQCQQKLRTTRLGKYFELHSSFLCAGGERGKDTCKGDGGSPLVCPIKGSKDRYYQAGIVAWGIGCGDEIPGVYANVPKLRNWIDEQLAYKRIDGKTFTP